MKKLKSLIPITLLVVCLTACVNNEESNIDRVALLERNNPHVTSFDTLASFTVGNGDFAMTVDITGMQTYPKGYSNGVPLGTMSTWGWHSFDNPKGFKPEDCYVPYDFGTGSKQALYSQQASSKLVKEFPRLGEAADWLRSNPHRLHLGTFGFRFGEEEIRPVITDIDQKLDLLTGIIYSNFKINGHQVHVETACHQEQDIVGFKVEADTLLPLVFSVPGPTGNHSDDACDWVNVPTIEVDNEIHVPYGYTVSINADHLEPGSTSIIQSYDKRVPNKLELLVPQPSYQLTICYRPDTLQNAPEIPTAETVMASSAEHWKKFWNEGAAVDFSRCTDPRAKEMERRVVLSQYLLAVNSAGHVPPQETGLTYNSWFGKFHLEMIYWHQAWQPLWGHSELLDRTLSWYKQPSPHNWAKIIAERQGYKGVRWMKMTDESGIEAPSKVGSFLIWQQPHPIYLAELVRRSAATDEEAMAVVNRYYNIVMETATFMGDFACWEDEPSTIKGKEMGQGSRFVLKGNIPAQETLRAAEVVNSPYELSEWRTVLMMAQHWRELKGEEHVARWDSIIDYLAPLAWTDGAADDSEFNMDKDKKYGKVYLACETTLDTYTDRRLTSDHMAVLGALGIYPDSRLIDKEIMSNTLSWVLDNWNWDKTWGWDYPMTAMCAARLNRPDDAVAILLNTERTNTYLPNGHNYQDKRLRCYLPGNGGLLTAVAMMCAGWDDCQLGKNPGWPKDGKWNVRWEGLKPLP